MNPAEIAIPIVAIVMIASVMKARIQSRNTVADPADRAETLRLKDEVKQLKERLHVLERIATDKDNSLAREIEELRDR